MSTPADISTRVRQLAQQYLGQYVNAANMMREEQGKSRNAYLHFLNAVCDAYKNNYRPSEMAWNFGDREAVNEVIREVHREITGAIR